MLTCFGMETDLKKNCKKRCVQQRTQIPAFSVLSKCPTRFMSGLRLSRSYQWCQLHLLGLSLLVAKTRYKSSALQTLNRTLYSYTEREITYPKIPQTPQLTKGSLFYYAGLLGCLLVETIHCSGDIPISMSMKLPLLFSLFALFIVAAN